MIIASANEKSIKIISVKYLRDMLMLVCFDNGETRLFDANILKGEVFNPLKDEHVLADCVVDHGIPTWCNGQIDCAPEYIYENSCDYEA